MPRSAPPPEPNRSMNKLLAPWWLLLLCMPSLPFAPAARLGAQDRNGFDRSRVRRLIVIYQENWSFDGLYSQFPGADGYPFRRDIAQRDGAGAPILTMEHPVSNQDVVFTT